jgi:hypothetical protein
VIQDVIGLGAALLGRWTKMAGEIQRWVRTAPISRYSPKEWCKRGAVVAPTRVGARLDNNPAVCSM